MLWPGILPLFRILTESFPAPHLVQDQRVHLLIGVTACPHDDIHYTAVDDHLGAEETRPYLGYFIRFNVETGKIECTTPRKFSCLQESIHLGMDTPAPLVVGTGGDIVFLSPAAVQLGAVHLFPWSAGIACGNDGIEFVNDDCTKVPPETGSLVGAPGSKVEEILMPVRPHTEKYGRARY
jgi:hypothetical protein